MNQNIPVYKIHLLNDSGLEHVYIFGNFGTDKLEKLWNSDPDNVTFDEIFGITEKQLFKYKPVTFVDLPIHSDDKIGTIKLKIANGLKFEHSASEIYLFALVEEKLNENYIYQLLTQNNQLILTKLRYQQFLSNLKNMNGSPIDFEIPDKEEYTFDDIIQLDLTNKKYLLSKPLGQKIHFSKEYPFVVNPYQITDFDSFLENSRKDNSTFNNSLLLETANIQNRNIYLCLAGNVFSFIERKKLDTRFASKIYYPFLFQENIFNPKELKSNKKRLIKQTKDQLSPASYQNFKIIDDLYKIDIFGKKTNDYNLENEGLKNFRIEIVTPFIMNLPIESIFRQINCDVDFPFVKFNPSIKKENIYRLYSNTISTKGQKIPFLAKGTIFKLIKSVGRESSITFYGENANNALIIEIYKNGFISVYNFNEFSNLVDESKLDQIISGPVNKLIDKLKPFLQQGGYDLKYFKSIRDQNIMINRLTYDLKFRISKELKFNSISSCFNTIFVTENDNLKGGLKLRYKRVNNFNEYDSQQAFIIEKQNQNYSVENIISELISNFPNINEEKATDLVLSVVNEEQIIKGTMRNRAITIRQNPGFFTSVSYDSITNTCLFSIDSINNIEYLHLIKLYINSLLHIQQDIQSTGLDVINLKKSCSSKKVRDLKFDDMIAVSEESILKNDVPFIEEETIKYDQIQAIPDVFENNMDDLLDALGFEEEEEEDEQLGGAESDSPMLDDESSGSNNISTSIPVSITDLQIDDNSSQVLSEDLSLLNSQPMSEKMEEIMKPESEKKESSVLLEEDLSLPSSQPMSEKMEEIMKPESEKKESSVVLEEDLSLPSSQPMSEKMEEIMKPESEKKESRVVLEEDLFMPSNKSVSQKENTNMVVDEIAEDSKILKKSVEGLKLSNPYYFQSLLEKRDPKLFLSLRDGKFDGYSRMCPSSARRQPTILTKSEFDKFLKEKNNGLIGKTKDGEYYGEDVIKYGSSPNNTHYYMCPKYWCLLNNQPLSQKQVDDGECGGKDAIIPKNAKSVPKGKSIFEFYEDSKLRYPGFHKEVTPNGHCIPCCYKLPYKDKKNNCSMDKQQEDGSKPLMKLKDKDNYIKGPEKVPLSDGRWGYLPTPIEQVFKDLNQGCSINKFTISPGSTCLLRLGVENSYKQSFIGAIATILFYGITDPKSKQYKIKNYFPNATTMVPSIKQMKELIINSLKKSTFSTYQNGDLISIFASKHNKNIQSYEEKLNDSFTNFINYLKNDSILIDYTYLWDIITKPNDYLFRNGINMILIEVVNNDETNNVEIICPTNQYSSQKYDPQLGSIIIIKQGNFYEPIFSYTNNEKNIQVSQIFYQIDKNTNGQLRVIMENIIDPIMNLKCQPIPNSMKVYKFLPPIKSKQLLKKLEEKKLGITQQIINFQGKVIGFLVSNSQFQGFVPCYPGSPVHGIEEQMFNEVTWNTYINTMNLLEYFFSHDQHRMVQIAEEKVIVGILSPTNQFIQIDPPLPITEANPKYPIIEENNYLAADIVTQLSKEKDIERIDFIKRISLESKFYNSFRNTLKIEINKYENLNIRKEIENISNNNLITYDIRLSAMKEGIRKLLSKKVIFVTKEGGFNINEINDIYTCVVLPIDKCNANKPVCVFNDGSCNLVIPKYNLVTNTNNEEFYFSKLADEILRYNRIKSFLLNPQTFISFGKRDYNLKEDEILILQSLITQSFFENKFPIEINEFANFNTYDTAHPPNETSSSLISEEPRVEVFPDKEIPKVKIDELKFEEGRKIEEKDKLCKMKKTKIISKKWKSCFPESFNELNYENSISCGYKLLKDIVYEIKKKNITTEEIKKLLITQYKYLINDKNINQNNLIKIFISEGKKFPSRELNILNYLEEYILQDDYWLSNLDLWILLNNLHINSVYISPFALRENNYQVREIVIFNNDEEDYLVNIILPSQINITIPNFKVVIDEKGKVKLPKEKINLSCFKNLNNVKDDTKIQDYINKFTPKKPIQFDIEKSKLPKKLTNDMIIIED